MKSKQQKTEKSDENYSPLFMFLLGLGLIVYNIVFDTEHCVQCAGSLTMGIIGVVISLILFVIEHRKKKK
jgi:hypothetical protein